MSTPPSCPVSRRSRTCWLLASLLWTVLLPHLAGDEIAFTVQGRATL